MVFKRDESVHLSRTAIDVEDTSFASALAAKSCMLANGADSSLPSNPLPSSSPSKKLLALGGKKESMTSALKPFLAHDRWSVNRNSEAPFSLS